MALPLQDSANAELRSRDAGKGGEERASSCHRSSSSAEAAMSSSREEAHRERAGSTQQTDVAAATPPPTQQMDRRQSSSGGDGAEVAVDPGRIPAAVFERDPSESNKDWSMMSTESVFGLQVAPSSDFTGFFLAHPELMDIATPPRTSTVDADAKAAVLAPHFESIPELPETTMKGHYSFAFPNLIEDKRPCSKKGHQEPEAAATTEVAEVARAPAPQPAEAKAEAQTSSKPEVTPEKGVAKGGLLSCFPCCS